MSFIKSMRDYANGRIDESAMQAAALGVAADDISEFENDKEFMEECTAMCMPTMIQMMLMDETADQMDENVKEAFVTVQNYLIGQGVISEAAAVAINNPKLNVIRLNKAAQLNRLVSIITLKMGRKQGHKAYKKYKLGQKIKLENRKILDKTYGERAKALAKKLWANTRRSSKIKAVVDKKK